MSAEWYASYFGHLALDPWVIGVMAVNSCFTFVVSALVNAGAM